MAGERILIVDDQESIRDLLAALCEDEGYEVATAEDGAEALALLERGSFDVGILDLLLPDIHGLDVLRRAKALYPEIEVIILTGHSDLQTAVEALRLGAYDYLQKPLADLQIIPLTIRRALDRQELSRRNERLVKELQAANEELERRRRQQFQSIQHIGRALTGALQPGEMAQVLVEAALTAIDCDGAGCLVLPRREGEPPRAFIAGANAESAAWQEAFLRAMIEGLPPARRPNPADVAVRPNPRSPAGGEGEVRAWKKMELQRLEGREGPLGVIALVCYQAGPFGEDAMDLLSILASQGSIALQNAHLFARMTELATRDSLTGLYNHGHFFELLAAEISRAERHGQELVVIMLDIDRAAGLKAINDTYGHQAGDRLLRLVGELLRSNVRQADVVARYGGDEFIVLAPQTDRFSGLKLAERLRQVIADTPFVINGKQENISVSVGVGVFQPGLGQNMDTVVSMADQSCYLAKERGGNQVAMVGMEHEWEPIDDRRGSIGSQAVGQ
ncbi:MAG: diguanylate cyclase [Chloroflexi bacterium]|nr:diguanylate cyclase [Chloroflexota bacterium]